MFNSRDSNRFSHHQFTSTNIFTDHTKSSCHNCTIVKPSDQGVMSLNIYGNIFQEKQFVSSLPFWCHTRRTIPLTESLKWLSCFLLEGHCLCYYCGRGSIGVMISFTLFMSMPIQSTGSRHLKTLPSMEGRSKARSVCVMAISILGYN